MSEFNNFYIGGDSISNQLVTYWSNGSIHMIYEYSKNMKNVKQLVYNMNNELKKVNFFKDDKQEGESLHFYYE